MVSKHVQLGSNHGRIGPAVELKVQASSSLYLKIENLKEVSHESEVFHESFVFTSSTFRFWRKSGTKASLSHIFNCRILREVSHEMHVWEIARLHEVLCFAEQNVSRKMCGEACPADGFETRSVRVESWPDRPRSGTESSGFIFTILENWKFEGSLARKLRFLTSSTVGFRGKSRTKCMFER